MCAQIHTGLLMCVDHGSPSEGQQQQQLQSSGLGSWDEDGKLWALNLGRASSPPARSTKGQGWPFPEATRRLKNFQMRAGQPKVTARWQRGVTCLLLGLKKKKKELDKILLVFTLL